MKNNKGYTLTELLLAIGIFAIVMVSIVALMNSTSVTYKNENFDIKVQEESQILVAQIEELLVDCKSVSVSGDKYTIQDINNVYSTLEYKNGAVVYSYNGKSEEVLCENVSEFEIKGVNAAHDNKCSISATVAMKENPQDINSLEYTYSSSKDVIFRNDVESDPDRSGSFLTSGTPTPGGGSGSSLSLTVGRFEVVNLTQKFDIVTVTSLTGEYAFLDNASAYCTDGAITSIHKTTSKKTPYITTSDTAEKAFSTSYSGHVSGLDSNGNAVEIDLTTDKFDLKKGSGVVEYCLTSINSGGLYSYIPLEGICLRDYEKYYGKKVKAFVEIKGKKNGTNGEDVYAADQGNKTSASYCTFRPDNNNALNNINISYDVYDPTQLVFLTFQGNLPSDKSNFDDGSFDVKVKLKIDYTKPDGNSASYTTSEQTYTLYCNGSKLNKL